MGLVKENENYCLECGSDIGYRGRKFCNNKCQGVYNSKNNPALIAWLRNPKSVNKLSQAVRQYLIIKENSKCSICSWGTINPHTHKIPLEVDHIDGNSENNTPENLRVICPNCHSLTSTYKGANKKSKREYRKKYCSNVRYLKEKEKKDVIHDLKEQILSADIDFSKFGWCTKVAGILDISPQNSREWMIRNMPEIASLAYKKS
jgi:5-methylcytosine-specific restriction endonuclease McrA